MVKIFISCPMKGRDQTEILIEQERLLAKAQFKLQGQKVEMIKSMRPDFALLHPLACLGHSLILLSGADYVVFGDGWEEARGCRIEHDCAEAYGIPILDLD